MFSKLTKNLLKSIGIQLTLFYSILTFILVSLVSFILYIVMLNIFYEANRQFLSDEIEILQKLVKEKENNIEALKQEVIEIPSALRTSVYHYYIRILDDKGHIILETPGIDKVIKTNLFEINTKNQRWKLKNNYSYWLMQSYFLPPDKKSSAKLFQVILDVSYQINAFKEYRKYIFWALFFEVLLSIMIGYLISKKGLHRLKELTEATKKITVTDIQKRIDIKLWPYELKELGSSFNQMLERIEAHFNQLTQYADNLAHEIRTPVTNIIGLIEVSLSHPHKLSAKDYQAILESNLEEMQRISQVVENLLFLAQAEDPKATIQKTALNIHREIEQICGFYQAWADEKNIKLSYEGTANLYANKTMFQRMINNLLSNALKYTNPGGTICFQVTEYKDHVKIFLKDSGVGIAKEHIGNIFNRFYRISKGPGVGLGLAIVKSIVTIHLGTISIESEPDQGTSITINLPK